FRSDNWPNFLLAPRDRKSLRTVNAVAIKQRQRRHFQLSCDLHELFRKRRAPQETEGAVSVKFDVRHTQIWVIPSAVEASLRSAQDDDELLLNHKFHRSPTHPDRNDSAQ